MIRGAEASGLSHGKVKKISPQYSGRGEVSGSVVRLVDVAIRCPLRSTTMSWAGGFDPKAMKHGVDVTTSRICETWPNGTHAGPDANVTTVPFVGLGADDAA